MVTRRPRWALGADEYLKRAGRAAEKGDSATTAQQRPGRLTAAPVTGAGIGWEPFTVAPIAPSDHAHARARFRRDLPGLVWNAARLEGNPFTLPEVQTLLDGVTVGGHRTEDAQQILALIDSYRAVGAMVASGTFALTKEVSDRLHHLVAGREQIESGHFRGEGEATGGGTVRLARGGLVHGVDPGPDGARLRARFASLLDTLSALEDPRTQALLYFAAATRAQFYFDGNKRTARLMMSGLLMSNGYAAIDIPYARRLEFNRALDTLFTTDDATELATFLVDCSRP